MTDDLEDRLRAHYRAREPGPAPDRLRQRVDASLAAEQRRPARLRVLSGWSRGWARSGFAAMAAVLAVAVIATAGLVALVRPWQGQVPAPGGAAATPDPRCASLTIDDVEAALRDTGSYRYTATGYLAPAGTNLEGTPPPVRRDVTGTGSYLAPDRYIETWKTGEATDPSAAGLSMADTLRVGSDQWTRDSAAAPPLWEKLEWPGSSDPQGGLIRLNWIDFERERAGWTTDPWSDMATQGRCVLVGGPGMLDTGGTVTVWLAVDLSTALPAAMRVEIDNIFSGSRLDYAVEYGIPVDIRPPGPGEVAPSSASPAAEPVPGPAAPVPEPFELRIYNRSDRPVRLAARPAWMGAERFDLGTLACGGGPLTLAPGGATTDGLVLPEMLVLYEVDEAGVETEIREAGDNGVGPITLVRTMGGWTAAPVDAEVVPSPIPCEAPPSAPAS